MIREKVSVVIPVYNGAAWIEECICSVLNQTWENFEIIVLDDHSNDGTIEILQKLVKKDSRIQLIIREGRGVSGARNEGIAQSNGEFVTFLDADDKLAKNMLETLIGHLREENSDMAACGYYRWIENSAIEEKDVKDYVVKTVDREHYLSDYLLHHYTHCWGVVYKRNVVENVLFREGLSIGEDMMFLMDLLPKLSKVTVVGYKGYYYRMNPKGATLKVFVPTYMDEVKSWQLAGEMIRREYPRCLPHVEGIKAVSALLVVGKIAQLSGKERKKYQGFVDECQRVVKEALRISGVRENLPSGYGIKTKLFMEYPKVYLNLYHLWKKK